MGLLNPPGAAQIGSHGRQVHAADVIALLREVYTDGVGTREEAEELIAFDQSLAGDTAGWTEFFAATIADHVTRRRAPVGIVDDEKAIWLIEMLSRGRTAATPGGCAAVMAVVENAIEVAPRLAAFAIRQMRTRVIAANRSSGSVRLNLKRSVDSESAAQIGRILLAAGQSGEPVSREEAEALFDLHDLTAGGTNSAEFDDLFFRAVAHHLIALSGARVPPRREALGEGRDFPAASTEPGADATAWLASQIMRDGRPTEVEFALLRYFTAGAGDVDPAIRQLMIQAA